MMCDVVALVTNVHLNLILSKFNKVFWFLIVLATFQGLNRRM